MNSNLDLNTLLTSYEKNIIFRCIAGSHSYGLTRAHSDEDIRGIFILPSHCYLSINEPTNMVSDARSDVVYYSLRRFMELLSHSNPNIVELLFTPSDCIQYTKPIMEKLFSIRNDFVTKQLSEGFIGFAKAQLKKARGQNKWINRSQPPTMPSKEAFAWFVPYQANQNNTFPARPMPLNQSGIDLSCCHVASLEHCPDVYRLYHIGNNAKGVFRNEALACESITEKEEKNNFIGLLIFNKSGFDIAVRDYHHYWEWRNNRNEQRWERYDNKKMDYDCKNMMHMFRLLFSSEHIYKEGVPLVRVEGENKTFLNEVLDGNYPFDELYKIANAKMDALTQLAENSSLADKPDTDKIDQLLYSLTQEWENTYA